VVYVLETSRMSGP